MPSFLDCSLLAWRFFRFITLPLAAVVFVILADQHTPSLAQMPASTAWAVFGARVAAVVAICLPLLALVWRLARASGEQRREQVEDLRTVLPETLGVLCLSLPADLILRQCSGGITGLIAFISANPQSFFAALCGAGAGAYWGYSLMRPRPATPSPAPALAVASANGPRDPEAQFRTAIHETGHLFIHAVLPVRPHRMRMEVGSVVDQEGLSGMVSIQIKVKGEAHEHELRWLMLLSMAGTVAEQCFTGIRGIGSVGDMRKWMQYAALYAENGFAGPYFFEAKDAYQMERNDRVFVDLLEEHSALLRQLFDVNRDLFLSVARDAAAKGRLGTKACHSILDKVVLTKPMHQLQRQLRDRFVAHAGSPEEGSDAA